LPLGKCDNALRIRIHIPARRRNEHIAFTASYTHMYAPGTRRHIKAALALGATPQEVMEVLKLCVVQGVQAGNLGVPILAEELAKLHE
jgi:alkylhydroperoxidase/carboxymuconolactone decarboxylase family protein YurZ